MLNLDQLALKIAAYRNDAVSFAEFYKWFEEHSDGPYAIPLVRDAIATIDAAISEYFYDGIAEASLKTRLATALRTFDTFLVVGDQKPFEVSLFNPVEIHRLSQPSVAA